MNKKKLGIAIIAVFTLLDIILLVTNQFDFEAVVCLIYNFISIFCITIWSGLIAVSDPRKKVISAFGWYFIIWFSLFTSIKTIICT